MAVVAVVSRDIERKEKREREEREEEERLAWLKLSSSSAKSSGVT
jgi:hypothetical protein